MRRFAFYFLVGSLAFAAGAISFRSLANQDTQPEVLYDKLQADGRMVPVAISCPTAPAQKEAPPSQKEKNVKFTCNDKTILAVLDEIRRDDDLQNDLEFYLKGYPLEDCKEMFRVEDKDLNGDGVRESFVMASVSPLCGHGGNCSAWVVSQKGRDRRVILGPVSIEYMEVDKGRSEGYKNLSTYGEAGGEFHSFRLYRYQGGKYKIYRSFETTHDSRGDEHFKLLKLKDCR